MTRLRLSLAAIAAAAGLLISGCSGSSAPQPTESSSSAAPTSEPTSGSTTQALPPAPTTYRSPPPTLPTGEVSLSTSAPPWLPPAVVDNGAQTARLVQAAGLPYAEEMLQVHYHAHLDIIADGDAVEVPAYLGYVVADGEVKGLAPLHTHDNRGIIHIENSVPATFVLGQVFIEWGVRFTPKCVGGLCAGDGKELAVFVNGKRYDGDPTRLVLREHQEIAIEYGDSGSLPTPPSSYEFPSGL